jgi:hypothetical protein
LATNRPECRVTVSVSPGLFFTTYFAAGAPDRGIEPQEKIFAPHCPFSPVFPHS